MNLATREAYGNTLAELKDNENVVVLEADLGHATKSLKFKEVCPQRFFNMGIAEADMIGTAAGLAACGKVPFASTFSVFATGRAFDQVRNSVCYPNLNVKFVGINSGLLGGEREGVTHQFYEDIGILSNIPNFTVLTPADGPQTYHAVKAAAEIPGPVYVRAGSGRENDVYEKDVPFTMDGIRILREYGDDTLLLSSGFVLDRVLKAADILQENGVHVTVGDVNIINAKDPSKVLEAIKKAKKIVTVEDHNVHGGLGAYISKLVVENDPKPVKRMGLTTFGESGLAGVLADHYGFSAENIADVVKNNL